MRWKRGTKGEEEDEDEKEEDEDGVEPEAARC